MTDDEAIACAEWHWLLNSRYKNGERANVGITFYHQIPATREWWCHEDNVCGINYPTKAAAARGYLKYFELEA